MEDPFNRNNAAVQSRAKAQNRSNVLQMKLIGQGHPTGLTNNLLRLFQPRPPLEYKLPLEKRKCPPLSGMAQFVSKFAKPGEPEYSPPVVKGETPAQRKTRVRELRLEEGAKKAAEELEKYDPSKDPNVTGDPYKTLFVARLSHEATEHKIKREFETYGPIKRVRLITDKKTNKPRGYTFIEYAHTRDMKTAYKQTDGRKLDSRRVVVDVERGRTVPDWRPRRLGGGLGTTRIGSEELNQKNSSREQQKNDASGHDRSEGPRAQDDCDREKSQERGRKRVRKRDRSPEHSYERMRDREAREDEHHHHKDKDKKGEREKDSDKKRDRGRERDHARNRDKERDRGRDHHREKKRDRPRERDRDSERDYDHGSYEKDSGYLLNKDTEYGYPESKHDSEKLSARDFEPGECDYRQEQYEDSSRHGHRHSGDQYDQSSQPEAHGLTAPEHDNSHSKQHEAEYCDDAPGKDRQDDYNHHTNRYAES